METSATSTCSRAEAHQFAPKLAIGEQYECILDRFAADVLRVVSRPVDERLQRRGIDRFWQRRDGRIYSVEYKTDFRAADTGRLFIETVSVDSDGKRGWAYTSIAQLLVQFIPGLCKVFIVAMTKVKERLPDWASSFQSGVAPNERYGTHGILLPIGVFRKQCQPAEFDWPPDGQVDG